MKNEILTFFINNNKFMTLEVLKKQMNIKGEEQTKLFYDEIKSLVEEGSLFFDRKKGYKLFTNDLGYACGIIEINKAGNGFVHTKDGYTIFVDRTDLNGALHGDRVVVSSIENGRREEFKGAVYKVLKRRTGNVIYEVVGNGCDATLIPYNLNENVSVNINSNQLRKLVDGQYILVNVGEKQEFDVYKAEIIKVIGHKKDADIDLKLIYEKNDVPTEFSKEALEEVDNLPTEVRECDLVNRVDLRDKGFITIDCDNTADRDDALYIEKLENGNYKLFVSISSVNYYVKKGTKLYEEALLRGNSYYPNNTCNPMFPHKLSNGICSLNENVDRLTKTVEMEINDKGEVVNYEIYNSVIRSRKQMKYSEVNKVLAGEMVLGYEDYKELLTEFNNLNHILNKAKKDRGYVDFNLPDIEMSVNSKDIFNGFKTTGIGAAESIIENAMLKAGSTVASHYSWLPFLYRIHEYPDHTTFISTIKLLKMSGYRIPKIVSIYDINKVLDIIIDKITDKEEAMILRTMLLKTMKRAKYSIHNFGHFALQESHHCHFTSPIRRIVDFRIHMLIDEIESLDYSRESIDALEKELDDICIHASKTERIAQKIESEALAMKMAEYMESHINEEYNAIVTEVYKHGMFVQTDNLITGKIKFENMHGDSYVYNDDKKAIIGKNTNKKYQIGSRVCVVVKDASKATRTINFEIGKQKSLEKKI